MRVGKNIWNQRKLLLCLISLGFFFSNPCDHSIQLLF